MSQISIRPGDDFVCPKTREKIDIERCIQRYVTANTLGKEHRLCIDCDYGRKNRARLAVSLDDFEEISVKRHNRREKAEIERRVHYMNIPLW